jgi:demethylmenaquinone methyltransferase / 2-methoxy-6-polyprenyl-1,4-benzoquinol methylase
LGQDAAWRTRVADLLADLPHGARVLDVGSGTGRLALAVQERHSDVHVTAADFSVPMLEAGPRSLHKVAADALRLPFSDGQFDAVVSGFLVRNLADVSLGIAEQVRVLRAGGTLAILETTPGPRGLSRWLYRLYFRGAVPLLGGLLAGDASAYTYLPESTLAFVQPARLAARMAAYGLEGVRTLKLMLGTVAVTIGRKPVIFPDGGVRE